MLNNLDKFINQEILSFVKENSNEVSSISFGTDSGCNLKNDIFVSVVCMKEHDGTDCVCRDMLNQNNLTNIDIDLDLAENIAYYISGLLGGKEVYRG